MKKYFISVLLSRTLLLLGCNPAKAKQPQAPLPSTFLFDWYMSPYASSPCLMSTRTGLSRAEDWLWQPSDHWLKRLLSSVGNNIANDLLRITSHEVAGHGFRARSLPALQVIQYRFVGVFPLSYLMVPLNSMIVITPIRPNKKDFNDIDGIINRFLLRGEYSKEEEQRLLFAKDVLEKTQDQCLLFIIGGSEANSVLGKGIIFKHFAQGSLDYRNYTLLYKTFGDLPEYIGVHLLSRLQGTNVPGDDITNYIENINAKHGANAIRSEDIGWASLVF